MITDRHDIQDSQTIAKKFLPLTNRSLRIILTADNHQHKTQIMANGRTQVDPRYMKYNKDEVEEILDGAVQVQENDDPMSLVSHQ